MVVDKVLRDCALSAEALTLILTPTTSLAGTTQVVARVLEVALHKAHELGFALDAHRRRRRHRAAAGAEPRRRRGDGPHQRRHPVRRPRAPVRARQRRRGAAARRSACRRATRATIGRSFAEIFKDAGFDFYKIDPALFAPAEVWVSNLDSGSTWHGGALDMALLPTPVAAES